MALSAVYRTGQRFGVNHVIDVLRGSGGERARQFGHDTLPTYGLGNGLDVNQWRSVMRQLVARGYLRVDIDAFGALKLEERCRPLLRGEETIELRRDTAPKRTTKTARTTVPGDLDPRLWEALRECRLVLAKEQGVPPYVIFHDSTLAAMCSSQPRDLVQLAHLPGVGERKLERYGEAFLAVLRMHAEQASSSG